MRLILWLVPRRSVMAAEVMVIPRSLLLIHPVHRRRAIVDLAQSGASVPV